MNATPFISIVIPTYNRPDRLSRCLQAIAGLDYPKERFEVIVVDDGSQVSLAPVVEPFYNQLNLTLISQANAGPAAARNAGAAKAQGELLVFTDDDCQPTSDWLTALEAQFKATPDCLLGGTTLNALPHNPYSTASQLLIDYLYSYYNANPQTAYFFASNNFALSKTRFQQFGSFDSTFPLAAGEDREFCDRWLQAGYRLLYVPQAQVNHAHPLTLRTFWRQHFNYGRGAFHFHRVRAQRGNHHIEVEPFSFYLRLLTYPFQSATSQPKVLVAALLLVSQTANVTGFFWEKFTGTASTLAKHWTP